MVYRSGSILNAEHIVQRLVEREWIFHQGDVLRRSQQIGPRLVRPQWIAELLSKVAGQFAAVRQEANILPGGSFRTATPIYPGSQEWNNPPTKQTTVDGVIMLGQ